MKNPTNVIMVLVIFYDAPEIEDAIHKENIANEANYISYLFELENF